MAPERRWIRRSCSASRKELRRPAFGWFGLNFLTCSGGGRLAREERQIQPRVLMQSFRDAIEEAGGGQGLVIGGKSMGGRIASMVADDAAVRGVVCLGYPFHPPGKLEKTRTGHLENLRTPTLILQGTRDSFGSPGRSRGYKLSSAIRIEWIEDGDHSFKPRARSGRTEADNVRAAIALVAEFIARA